MTRTPWKTETVRWTTRFGRFVDGCGIDKLASDLGINRSTLYNYLNGRTEPRRTMIAKIVIAAKARAFRLTISDIHRHSAKVRNEREASR